MIGLISYTTFLKNSRDSKRQSDLKFIQSALEEYHSDQIYYPAQNQVITGSSLVFGSKIYINKIPIDPIANTDYKYTPSPNNCNNSTTKCTSYCIYAKLEGSPPPPSDYGSTRCPTISGGYNYGVTRP